MYISIAEDLLAVINKFLQNDADASVKINVDEDNAISVMFFQSGHMKNALKRFPELIILDTTYNINNRKMPLATAMVVDGEGHGHVAGHALMSGDTKENWTQFLEAFKLTNDDAALNPIFIVDKAFQEITSIHDVWSPDVKVQLCLFHVKNALQRRIQAEQRLRGEEKALLNDIVCGMIHSNDERAYDDFYLKLTRVKGNYEIYIFTKSATFDMFWN